MEPAKPSLLGRNNDPILKLNKVNFSKNDVIPNHILSVKGPQIQGTLSKGITFKHKLSYSNYFALF